jgi:RNA polymerase sigma-70 factor (ECF subfamily)
MERWIGARDPEAFAQLVDRHAGMVLAACRRVLGNSADAEETAQECFLQVSQAKRAIRPSLGGWLHRLATNRALDRLRSDKARAARERDYAVQQPGAAEPSWNDIQPHVDAIIAQLADELQTPLVLHFFEGQTHREVARALGIGRSTVTERIQRAIGEIREQLAAKHITLGLAALASLFGALEVSAAPLAFVASLKKIGIATGRSAPSTRFPMKWRAAAVAGAIVVLVAGLWVSNMGAEARDADGANSVASSAAPSEEIATNAVRAPLEVVETSASVLEESEMTLTRADAVESTMPAPEEEEEMLRLRCVDEQGKPVAGAEVYHMRIVVSTPPMLQTNRPEDTVRQPFGPVRSDGKGYVEVPATHKISASSSGYASAYARVPGRLVGLWQNGPRSREITGWDSIVMVPSTRIGGVVKVPEGFDATKVSARILTIRISMGDFPFDKSMTVSSKYQPPLWPKLFEKSPSRDGAYSFEDIPSGHTCYLEFTAPGLGEAQRYNFKAYEDEAVDVELLPEASVSGTVRHATGEPAVDVPVFACPHGGPDSSIGVISAFQARTDARGTYMMKGLPEETYAVFVQHYGEPPAEITRVEPALKLVPGEQRRGLDFTIEAGALQAVTVLDRESGQSVPEVRLIAMNSGMHEIMNMSEAIGSASTDINGRCSLRLPVGASFVYFFEVPDDYLQPEEQGHRSICVATGQSELPPLTFQLTRKSDAEKAPIDRATIEGRVLDEEGRAVAGVPVRVNQMSRPGVQLPFESEARPTGDDGRFSVSVLSVGEYQIIVGGGGMSSRVESEWVTLQAGETRSVGDLRVAPFDQVIAVILTGFNEDPEASPPHVSIKKRDLMEDVASGFVDESGRIALHAPDVPLLLTISQEGYKVVQMDVEPDTETEIALEPEEAEVTEQEE